MSTKFKRGDLVRKANDSEWSGKVASVFLTSLGKYFCAVESATEEDVVESLPEADLELRKAPRYTKALYLKHCAAFFDGMLDRIEVYSMNAIAYAATTPPAAGENPANYRVRKYSEKQ